jgi:hypothetical protein
MFVPLRQSGSPMHPESPLYRAHAIVRMIKVGHSGCGAGM